MRLTRRDGLKAAFAGSVTAVSGLGISELEERINQYASTASFSGENLATLVSIAEVVYPSSISGIGEFVEAYARSLSEEKTASMDRALRDLNRYVLIEYGSRFEELSPTERNTALRELGVNRVHPAPDSSAPGRIRYFLVNQLLYGLLTSPKGSQLFGINNPVGHPGGFESYQRRP